MKFNLQQTTRLFINVKSLTLLTALALCASATAFADSATGGAVSAAQTLQSVNFSSANDWAFYGEDGDAASGIFDASGPGAGGVSDFSDLTAASAFSYNPSYFGISFTGGTNDQSRANDLTGEYYYQGYTFSATLASTTETFNIYADALDDQARLTISNGSTQLLESTYTLPVDSGGNTQTGGLGSTAGVLSFTVSGAVGDTISFEVDQAYVGGGNENIGIQGVTMTEDAVPEPSTWALLLSGFVSLLAVSTLRRKMGHTVS